jgi:hypothetical protein
MIDNGIYEVVLRRRQAYVIRRHDDQLLGALTKAEACLLKLLAHSKSSNEVQEALGSSAGPLISRVQTRFSSLLESQQGIAVPASRPVMSFCSCIAHSVFHNSLLISNTSNSDLLLISNKDGDKRSRFQCQDRFS